MNLTELVSRLKSPENFQKLLVDVSLSEETEAIEVYLRDALELNSEVHFFRVEETDGDMTFERNGVSYLSFFSLLYVYEMVQDLLIKEEKSTDMEIAKTLLNFRIKDA